VVSDDEEKRAELRREIDILEGRRARTRDPKTRRRLDERLRIMRGRLARG
jgi:hypothetical protein